MRTALSLNFLYRRTAKSLERSIVCRRARQPAYKLEAVLLSLAGVDGRAGTILLSRRRKYNPVPEAAATGRRRRSNRGLIYGSSGYFIRPPWHSPPGPVSVYLHSTGPPPVHVSVQHQTALEHESLYGRYFPVQDEIVVDGWTRSADHDGRVKRSLLSFGFDLRNESTPPRTKLSGQARSLPYSCSLSSFEPIMKFVKIREHYVWRGGVISKLIFYVEMAYFSGRWVLNVVLLYDQNTKKYVWHIRADDAWMLMRQSVLCLLLLTFSYA